ncbi:hypothetical protein Cni_G09918 [Canna indica]|uniref:RNase H type-1 domain-containing protein n=1 Tax=Canna indica TaxID=4628 RepID=A0AAQ3K4X3_9LILI|nr:hypothetical protein Cni_G09918 [Canna indica]
MDSSKGSGIVVRDYLGNYVFATCNYLENIHSPSLSEACAILDALRLASSQGYQQVVIETDSKLLYQAILK